MSGENDLPRMKTYHESRRRDAASAPDAYEFSFVNRNRENKDVFVTVGAIPGTRTSIASLLDITERRQTEGGAEKERKIL